MILNTERVGVGAPSLPLGRKVIHSFGPRFVYMPTDTLLLTGTGPCDYSTPLFSIGNTGDFHRYLPVVSYEKNLSTQQSEEVTHPWLSRPHGNPQRPQDTQGASRQRPGTAGALINGIAQRSGVCISPGPKVVETRRIPSGF